MNRGKQQLFIFLSGFIAAVILLAGGYLVYNMLVDTGKLQSVSLPIQTADAVKKAKVLVSVQRIEKGDELKPELFQLTERNPEEVPANSIIDISMITDRRAAAVIDLKEILTDSKLISTQNLYNPDDRLKDYALQGYLVADTVKAGDWIDVEMVRSNGDTFMVLAKKQVIQLTDNKAIIKVTTAERALVNHAIAEQSAGMGHIESLLYLDEKQPASEVTYIPARLTTPGTQAVTEPVKSTPATSTSAKNESEKAIVRQDININAGNIQSNIQSNDQDKQAGAKEAQGGRTR
jgi:flagella basal body P-ring formation protein FlgA